MKITKVTPLMVEGRHWPRFPWVLVEVHTDEGITGLGEALNYRSSGVVEGIRSLGPQLVGEDPFNVERLWETMYRQGGVLPAISGIEIALWDIIGKALKTPLYNLFGGRCRDRIRVYVDGFFRGAAYKPDEYAEKAVETVDEGFTALKMDIDGPLPSIHTMERSISRRDLRYTAEMVGAVRSAVGDDVDLAVDCHGSFNTTTAIALAKKLEKYDLMWIEDPVPSGNAAAMAKVAEAVETPICTGELLNTRYEFRELLERQGADIIMPDIVRTGGISEMKKIAAIADTYYVPVAPHNMVSPVATMASIHFCASTPNFTILEFQLGDVPWKDQMLDQPLTLKQGYLEVPKRPGLGIALNTQEIQKHVVT